MKKVTLIIFIILMIFGKISSQNHYYNQNKFDGDQNYNDYCPTRFLSIQNKAHLGTIFIGTTNSNLPAFGGDRNDIVFVLKGDSRINYSVKTNTVSRVNASRGYVNLDLWTWEIESDNFNKKLNNKEIELSGVKLKRQSMNNECESFARFTIFANQITASTSASPGSYKFDINVTVQIESF